MTFASIPSPPVSTFELGPLTIHVYALCILAGVFVAVAIANVRWRRVGGDFDQILDIAVVSVLAGIVGARLYHVVTTPERFFGPDGDPAEIVRVWNGGLGIWGGILFGVLAAWAWCRRKGYPMALLADAVAPALLVAQAVGRLGNWFNRELYGAATTLPWGLDVDGSGTLYHPTFLYEMVWNLAGAALIVWVGRRAGRVLKAGSLLAVYVMWYTAGRTWIEALRIDYAHTFLGVRVNVWVSMAVFVCGVAAFVAVQRLGSRTGDLVGRLRAVTEREERLRDGASGHETDAPAAGAADTSAAVDAVDGEGARGGADASGTPDVRTPDAPAAES
ncbi:prolipoprotein diacylglyceryl transferase [Bifidobacterium phasiani]|uniref:Phosphatidylglycerol--prolipoprotein diacylglyceryl transferase n=1 Tax=Bifidobacterium phasiani TaxID=2834431 RepID=A0ABS6WB77_9BIFI|nr:prolipoprotein diacylglyceryl transferase [Bifidobacterium phasiani]MBW3083557.1 prolipoprotein diacylglyceryl transferase [Bifidobacterium phasiani]